VGKRTLVIRAARPDEGELLREIAIAAKSHWGYNAEWVREWAARGDFSPQALRDLDVFVAEHDGRVVGWAAAMFAGDIWWLDDLWVVPEAMLVGIGTRLFQHAAALGRGRGATRMEWEAEPNALGFYEKMGAGHVRDNAPNEWGRVIAVMAVDLAR